MFTDSLERAIGLIERGKPIEAKKILKRLIAADHHNLPAWFWLLETCSTNEQRINVLEICLENNPDSEQVKQALERLRSTPLQKISVQPTQPITENNSRPLEIVQNNSYLYLAHAVLFIFSFCAAFIVSALLSMNVIAIAGGDPAISTLPIYLSFLPYLPFLPFSLISLPIFPIGLFAAITQTDIDSWSTIPFIISLVIGWLMYFAFFLFGTFTKKRSVFIIIYLVFITLLIMNIIGCVQSATQICPKGSLPGSCGL